MDFFGGSKSTPPPAPTVLAPPVMPIPDDKAAKDAQRRKAALMGMRGREGTILSQGDQTDTLGG